MNALKLRKIGGSVGIILPKETLARLKVSEGDLLYIHDTRNGVEISPLDPDFEATIKAFSRTRKKYRNALHELAK